VALKRALEIVVALVIIASAFAFGGVQPVAYSLMEIILLLVLLLVLFRRARNGSTGLHVPLWPLLFGFWVVLEMIPLPASWVIRLSPARALDPNLAASHWASLSINPHDTALMLMKFVAYVAAFVLAAYFFDFRKRRNILLSALIALGIFEAAYGTVQYLTGWQKIFTFTKQYYTFEGTGTYINHNHFAGLLELVLPFLVASIFYRFQLLSEKRAVGGRSQHVPGARDSSGLQALFYLFLAVILVVGVICSKSRGGIVGTVFSVVLVAVLAQLKTGQRTWLAGLVLFLVCVGAYGMWIGLGPVFSRFEEIGQTGYAESEGRLSTWRDDLRLIHDYPVAGTGFGTFGLGFRHYQTEGVNFFFDHAHNDFLELASDTGLVGAALLFLPIFGILARMIASFLNDPRRYRRAVTLGCIGSVAALLVHSVTDFNLQIPANALVFAVVLGIGYKAAVIERRLERQAASAVNASRPVAAKAR
jgi:O-antigen ligase